MSLSSWLSSYCDCIVRADTAIVHAQICVHYFSLSDPPASEARAHHSHSQGSGTKERSQIWHQRPKDMGQSRQAGQREWELHVVGCHPAGNAQDNP
jgi:hypothetical protein